MGAPDGHGPPRVALIGYGRIAESTHRPALALAGCRVAAVVEPDPARRALAAAQLPEARLFADTRALWRAPLPLDFVDICSPPALHYGALCEAARAGCHALCEKPLVLEPRQVAHLEGLGAGGAWAVGYIHNWLCAPAVAALLRQVAAGTLGALSRIEATTLRTVPAAGASDDGSPWRQRPEAAGGGILMDHGWHGLGILLRLAGRAPTGLRTQLRGDAGAALEHTARLCLDFGAGLEGEFFATWRAAGRHNHLRAVGERGVAQLDDDTLTVQLRGAEPVRQTFAESLADGGYRPSWTAGAISSFVRALREPALRRPLMDEAGLLVQLIARAYLTPRADGPPRATVQAALQGREAAGPPG